MVLGARDASVRAIVQIDGDGLRIESDLLRRILPRTPTSNRFFGHLVLFYLFRLRTRLQERPFLHLLHTFERVKSCFQIGNLKGAKK